MPTIFSHAIFASALGNLFPKDSGRKFWLLTALCAIAPDFDAVSFYLGISYASILGHRGITHSIFFAVLLGLIVSLFFRDRVGRERLKLAAFFTTVTLSHPLLDMFTNGGLGVALLAPFTSERFFFPWRPIEVSPIGVRFFSERGIPVILSEILWIWIPSAVLVSIGWLVRRNTR